MSWNNGRKNGIWPCLIRDKLTSAMHEPIDTKNLYGEQYEIMPSNFNRHTLQAGSPIPSALSAAIRKAGERS